MYKIAGSILVLLTSAAIATAQPAKPSFEVASVKRSAPLDPQKMQSGQQRIGMKVNNGRVDLETMSVSDLLGVAYGMRPNLVVGPSWLGLANAGSVERFDIHATMPEGATREQVPAMLRSLLADRFKLEAHREKRDQNVYALIVGRNGTTLEPAAPLEAPAAPAAQTNRPEAVQVTGGQSNETVVRSGANTSRVTMGQDGSMHLVMERSTTRELAVTIERFLDRPVVDLTELKGFYKITLDLSKDDLAVASRAAGVAPTGPSGAPGGGASEPAGTSVMQSVERLGLKLDGRKAPVEYLVIDRLERTPTED